MSLDHYKFALRDWQANADNFKRNLVANCQQTANAAGYRIEVDEEAILIAHKNWVGQCLLWMKERVQNGTKELSHIKVLAILLHQLVSVEWVKEIYVAGSGSERLTSKPERLEKLQSCIQKGRGSYLAFQFVISLINWFETARRDSKQPFVFRLTPDLEHDIMVYLGSEARDELSTFLILKALYARKGERAN
jgi:hypothetical protein